MIDHHETPALWDCETLTPIPTNETILTRFWDGFERLDGQLIKSSVRIGELTVLSSLVRLRDEDHNERLRIIKLKDWPTKKDFATVFPTRLHDLMKNIPFGEFVRCLDRRFQNRLVQGDYTRRSYTYQGVTYPGGSLNIVERLPVGLVKPDLGPKLYIAYSKQRLFGNVHRRSTDVLFQANWPVKPRKRQEQRIFMWMCPTQWTFWSTWE